MHERLQKIIARAGLASRREAERLIEDGLVTVNGKTAHLGDKADPAQDHVKVKGRLIPRPERYAYFLFYKPRGILTAAGEDPDHPTVSAFFKEQGLRLFPVGRLDLDSEGLLLVTNDGELAHGLMHPASEVPKRYRVKTKGVPGPRAIALLQRGVPLEDGRTAPAEVRLLETTRTNAWLEVIIHEGRYRQVRRMFDQVGHSVLKLKRTAYAFLKVGALKPGAYRVLSASEVDRLRALTRKGPDGPAPKGPAAKSPKGRPHAAKARRPAARRTTPHARTQR
jgi:23S rRNA pseudouridine2605 synthase